MLGFSWNFGNAAAEVQLAKIIKWDLTLADET